MNENNRIQTVDPDRAPRRLGIKNLMPGLVERGKIKIGNKGQVRRSSQGKEFQAPQKLDHFLVTTMVRGDDNNFLRDEAIHKQLGDKPTTIPVRLLYDDIDLNFQTRYACYNGRTLWCSGDGEVARRVRPGSGQNGKPLEYDQVSCTCERQSPTFQGKGKCKITGNLSVMIDGVGVVGGVWKFRTTSYNSVVGILSSLALIKRITGGPLAGIPLNMVLTPKAVSDPVTGAQQTVYVVSLEFRGTVDQLRAIGHDQLLSQHQHQLRIERIEEEARALLTHNPTQYAAPDDEGEDVEEFYPEEVEVDHAPRAGIGSGPTRAPANDNRPETAEAAAADLNAAASQRKPKPAPKSKPKPEPEPEPIDGEVVDDEPAQKPAAAAPAKKPVEPLF